MISMLLVGLLKAVQAVPVVFAQNPPVPGSQGNTNPIQNYVLPNPLGTNSFLDIINRILQGLTIIAMPIVAIIVVVAGFQLITSGGAPEKRTKAKDMILWAAIGFGVLLLADSVALIVQNFLTS